MNLAILTGGLYFLLYEPVKQFMDKREEHYKERDRQADEKIAQAERLEAEYRDKLAGADEEIRQTKARVQQSVQQSAQEQLDQARAQAEQIVDQARAQADRVREQARHDSQQDIRRLAETAARRLALQRDPFDQFLDLAEGGKKHEGQ
ncbi:MAG: ATP synthase F0 subunit B [Oscillospiraceae bacterium]|nr:ATP synthase F0 subunit B [Oscillospiraceae bacterium]